MDNTNKAIKKFSKGDRLEISNASSDVFIWNMTATVENTKMKFKIVNPVHFDSFVTLNMFSYPN